MYRPKKLGVNLAINQFERTDQAFGIPATPHFMAYFWQDNCQSVCSTGQENRGDVDCKASPEPRGVYGWSKRGSRHLNPFVGHTY